MTSDDDIIRAAAEAASTQTTCTGLPYPTELHYRIAEAVIAAVTPLIRAQIADEIEAGAERSSRGVRRRAGMFESADIARIVRGDAQ